MPMICSFLHRPTPRARRCPQPYLSAFTPVLALLVIVSFASLPYSAAQPDGLRQGDAASVLTSEAPVFQCPMHSHVTSDEAGRCPICGMDLVPVLPEPSPAADDEMTGTTRSAVAIDAGLRQQLGVRLGRVERRVLRRTLSAPARIVYDETRLLHIHPRASGWIEGLELRAEGEPVAEGQVLATFYSPEILAAQVNFLVALEAASGARQAHNARNLLRLLAVPESLIQTIERDRETRTSVPILAPGSGVLTKLEAREGMYVTPATEMFTIADLSTVWLLVDLRERESTLVNPGQHVELRLDALPGQRFDGRVDYLYPEIDEPTRLRRARVILANAQGLLQPGMFARAEIHGADSDAVLAVERGAVLDDGEQRYVLRALDDGSFQPVVITTGRHGDNWVEVLSPLAAGDRIATSAQFLIDAESDLQAELQRLDGSASAERGARHEH